MKITKDYPGIKTIECEELRSGEICYGELIIKEAEGNDTV